MVRLALLRVRTPGEPTDAVRAPPGTFKIGTIAGSDVLVSSSWFVIAAVIAVAVAPRAEQEHPGLGAWNYVAGFAFAIVLYLSVLLHEASHALAAKHYGFPVSAITLHFLGGLTAHRGGGEEAAAGVLDRGGRAAHLAGGRAWSPWGCGSSCPTACC